MAYLIKDKRKNPETEKLETYYRIGEKIGGVQQPSTALGFVSEAEAKRLVKVYEGKRAAGHDPLPKTEPVSSIPDFARFYEERFLPRVQASGRAAKTIRGAEDSGKRFERMGLGKKRIDQITSADADRYIVSRRADGMRARTIQIELTWLKKALELAYEDKLIQEVPKIQRPPLTDRKPHRYLTLEEADRLVAHLPWNEEYGSAVAIFACLNLGTRKGEILSRRWSDVLWTMGPHGSLRIAEVVREGKVVWRPKTGKPRTVPLTPALRQVLEEAWERVGKPVNDWIFPSPYCPGEHQGEFRRGLEAACKRADLPYVHPHGLRHSWATHLAIRRVPKVAAMQLGGWTSSEMLEEVYQHVPDAFAMQVQSEGGIALPRVRPPRRASEAHREA